MRSATLRTAGGSAIRSDRAPEGSVAREGRAHMSVKILVVEDDPAIVELITYNLDAEGFNVVSSESGEEAQMLVNEEQFDLILLDWMLPGVSGIELCRRLRQRSETMGVPVIMLTARGEEGDRVRGLATGADDYIVKPFSVAELVARVKAMLRRAAPERVADMIAVGDVSLDRLAHRVKRAGREVRLGPTEYRLLEFMMERAGRVLSREQILDGVWGRQAELDERTVDVHIGRLRKALVRGKEAEVIRTVRGAGYVIEHG